MFEVNIECLSGEFGKIGVTVEIFSDRYLHLAKKFKKIVPCVLGKKGAVVLNPCAFLCLSSLKVKYTEVERILNKCKT